METFKAIGVKISPKNAVRVEIIDILTGSPILCKDLKLHERPSQKIVGFMTWIVRVYLDGRLVYEENPYQVEQIKSRHPLGQKLSSGNK